MIADPSTDPVLLAGTGAVLPGLPGPDGLGGPCVDAGALWEVFRTGTTCLSRFDHPGIPLRIAGQVRNWDPATALGVPERIAARMARVTALSIGAVRSALDDAGLTPEDLNDDRTVLVIASMQFAFQEAGRYFAAYERGGPAALGMDYWLTGTPGSVASGICSVLGIRAQTLNITGGCNCSLRAMEVATTLLHAGTVDRAVVVGADATLDRIFLASTVHEGKRGFRASTLSADPGAVRPHDQEQDGNAPGEGALAVVLESGRPGTGGTGSTGDGVRVPLRLRFRSSRNNGINPVDSGTSDNFVADVQDLLTWAGIGMDRLAFINGFAEGTRNIEDLFCDTVEGLRKAMDYGGILRLTNQEAAFGHISGCAGLLKFVSSALMFRHGTVGPVVGCRTPYARLDASPVLAHDTVPVDDRYALLISSGAGGDATSLLIEYLEAQ
ncbi:beta-ketoacyl synthase N-terminal-like domain-containing protein [Streptomyces gobiensis]|uniref:beta-ketoacyl synthase N-terminal-like domain-containing protein n=1 Tax=Streptomyces gobiensis TaxID=2875706 RepID=UPI001E621767|nr:beta-ketoacyl synthase N-terminal-like domain-containing protein [Streptomyces gobiensis]UGY94148.1 3-oxoacyl-ACP synthase [Streptomyces gobiensis]